MPMPNRNIQDANGYRYAYQGQEKDPETGKEAFELRLWDGRIGRWLSPDPYGEFHSPYLGMGNNPISNIDINGGCVECPENGTNGQTYTDSSGTEWTHNSEYWDGGFSSSAVVVTGSNGSNAARHQRIYNFFNPVDLSPLVNWMPEPGNANIYGAGRGIDYKQDENPNDHSSPWAVDVSQMTKISGGGTKLKKYKHKKGYVQYTIKYIKFGKSWDKNANIINDADLVSRDTFFNVHVTRPLLQGKGYDRGYLIHGLKGKQQVDSLINMTYQTYQTKVNIDSIVTTPNW